MSRRKKTNFSDAVTKNMKDRKERKSSYGYLNLPKGVSILKIEEGTNILELDFIPYEVTDTNHPDRAPGVAEDGMLWYKRPFKIHRQVGIDDESVVCPLSVGKPCSICEYRKKIAKEGADKDTLKELYPKERHLYTVIPIDVKGCEEIVHIWDVSSYLFHEMLEEELELNPDDRDFMDLDNGKTLEIKFRWKSFGSSKFPDARSVTFLERDPYEEDILDETPNLDKVLKVLPYESLEAKFFQADDEADAGELEEIDSLEEERPARKRKTARSRRRRKEDTKEDDKEDAEKRPTERPTRRGSRKEPPKEDAEEKAEEKPARRRKSKPKGEDNKCPHDHKFGIDTEKYPEDCDICNVWNDCMDEKEAKEEE